MGVRSQESILLLKADWVSCCASEDDCRLYVVGDSYRITDLELL